MKHYKLTEYITLQVPTEDYSTGELVITNSANEFFWGNISEERSQVENGGVHTDGRLRDSQIIKIIARTRDTNNVMPGGELTFDSIDGTFNVVDKYDLDFKHYVIVMAEKTT